MISHLSNLPYTLFEQYGIELIGSFLLATIIRLFFVKSTAKIGLKYLSYAFYTLVLKNLVLIGLDVYNAINPSLVIPSVLIDWLNLSFICTASALFLTSALQILHLLFTGINFAVVISLLLIVSGYIVGRYTHTADLFTLLPNIYIASSFLIVGLSLVMIKSTRQNALKATGIGFILLGVYYIQTTFNLIQDDWFYQATIYLIVLVLSLSSQITLMNIYCTTLENNLVTEKARRDLILDASPFPVLITKLVDDQIIYINAVAKKLFNIETSDIPSFTLSNYFINPEKRIELISRIKRETVIHSFEVQMKKPKTQEAFWLDLSTRIIDLDGELALYTTFKDVTQNKHKEEKLFEAASTDPLTGLFNRRQFETMATTQLSLAHRYNTPHCIIMIDIDHFKRVNDTYGHDAGDEVLKYIALVLKTSLRASDILARYGGEEFILFLPHTSPTEAWQVAERLRSSVEQSKIKTKTDILNVTISLGLSSTQTLTLDEQIKEADTALYASKTTGRNKATLYTPALKKEDKA